MRVTRTTPARGEGALHVTHVITTLEVGGAQVVLAHLAAGLRSHGVTSDVVVLGPTGPLHDRVAAAGADVVAMDRRPAGLVGAVRELRAHLERRRPDVVHAWLYHAEVVVALARPQAPVVFGVHHTDVLADHWPRPTRVAARVANRLSNRADAVVYPGEASRRVHEDLGRPPALGHVIPNGIPRPAPHDGARGHLRERLGVGADVPVVGRIGRAHAQKDLPTFVAAVAVARRRHPALRAVIAGPGIPEDLELARAIGGAGLGAVVHRWDALDDVADLHAGLDLAVSSSSAGEALPTVLLEALAVGIPVVATDVGDSARIVGSAGRVVPPRDPDELGGAIADLLDLTPEQREDLGRRGGDRVLAAHGVAAMTTAWAQLYGSLTNADGAGPGGGPRA